TVVLSTPCLSMPKGHVAPGLLSTPARPWHKHLRAGRMPPSIASPGAKPGTCASRAKAESEASTAWRANAMIRANALCSRSPSRLDILPHEGKPQLLTEGEELRPAACKQRRLQHKMDRQRRANNPENYNEQGRTKKQGGKRLQWKISWRSLKRRSRSQRL